MLALAATNAVAVVLFGTLYAVGGQGYLAPGVFPVALAAVFLGATALWLRAEAYAGAGRDALGRLGRAAGGLALVLVVAPVAVLTPLFALRQALPPGAPEARVVAPVMAVLLLGLVLVVAVNLAGATILAGRAVLRRRRPPAPR